MNMQNCIAGEHEKKVLAPSLAAVESFAIDFGSTVFETSLRRCRDNTTTV
jgi:hypothetical protein